MRLVLEKEGCCQNDLVTTTDTVQLGCGYPIDAHSMHDSLRFAYVFTTISANDYHKYYKYMHIK